MPVLLGPWRQHFCVVYVDGPLRAPLTPELRRSVEALLRRGDTLIVVDLARVSRIDAAGIGELVGLYNKAAAANGLLQIAHPTPWVRDVLGLVGLLEILSNGTL
jgi:anti-anti-sigma factor